MLVCATPLALGAAAVHRHGKRLMSGHHAGVRVTYRYVDLVIAGEPGAGAAGGEVTRIGSRVREIYKTLPITEWRFARI